VTNDAIMWELKAHANHMDKITHTAVDGTTTDYFPQSYTDAAVAAAVAAIPAQPPVADDTVEVDLVKADGSTKKFVAA
jgi:hypothetical protein